MKALLFGLLALLPSVSMAGGTYANANPPLIIGSEQILPHRGGYWDPAAPGSGYFVDVIRRNTGVFGFATAYTYDEQGRSTFLILQGNIEFASETQRRAEGWFARLVSPTYQAADGQPFGGAYRPALVTPSAFGEGTLTWKTRRTAELRVGDRVTQIRTLHPDDAATEATNLLGGYWKIQVRRRSIGVPGVFFAPQNQQFTSHVVRLTPVTPAPTWGMGNGAAAIPQSVFQTLWLPPANVLTFEVTCISECLPVPPQTIPAGTGATAMVYNGARVWIDPVTLRAGWVQNAVVTTAQATSPSVTQFANGVSATVAYDLYVDDDTAVGRGLTLFGDNNFPPFSPGAYPGSELLMTRITPNGLHAPLGQEIKLF